MKNIVLFLVISSIFTAEAAHAGSLLVKNATIMTMGEMGVLTDSDIFVKDGEISAIGTQLNVQADTVIDAGGRTVTPGMFAGPTATGLVEVDAVAESVDSSVRENPFGKLQIEFDVRRGYSPRSSIVDITRVEGFSYALLAANRGQYSVAGIGSLVDFDGGFTSFSGDDTVFIDVDGYSARKVGGSRAAHWMLLEGAMRDIEGRSDDQEYLSQAGRQQLKQLKSKGTFVFSANRAADINQVMIFVDTYDLNAVILGGREAWMLADELADQDIPVMLNGLDNLPADFDSLGARLDNASILDAAGVTVMFTSDETHNARKIRQGAGNAVSYGMDYEQAVKALTTVPSEVFGGRSRSINVGNTADFVIWSGDPLEVTTYATAVIIDGRLTSMESRQTKLLERYLPEDAGLGRAYLNR